MDLLSLGVLLRQNIEGTNVDLKARQLAQTAKENANQAISLINSTTTNITELTNIVNNKSDKPQIISTSDPIISLTLNNNTILQCNLITDVVNVTLGDNIYANGYITDISFTSGATATNWNVPNPLFTGIDCEENVFIPQPNKRYNVTMFWDGQYIIGLVIGNEITI